MTDRELLEHYIARGKEGWNVSIEASWLDYELRRFVVDHLPPKRPLNVCNVGIGVGLWDDWLARLVGRSITSVDIDPEVCRVLTYRQLRERHPFPSHVICGDAAAGLLPDAAFDVITCVGSTLDEAKDKGALRGALSRALVHGGLLLIAEAGTGATPSNVRTFGDTWLACTTYRA
jgi:protein-L-isoaspartate O-methyltransferase